MLGYKEILENLYGIAYLIDRGGYLVDYSEKNWNDFAISNNSYDVAKRENIIGKEIYSFISDTETKETYKKMNELIFRGQRGNIHFYYRCDAPEYRRDMKMCITPVRIDGEVKYALYQSILLSETMRPPMNIFRNKSVSEREGTSFITICSYCKNIKKVCNDDEKTSKWITPEEYYKNGGKENVMLSHGICTFCYENIVLKFCK